MFSIEKEIDKKTGQIKLYNKLKVVENNAWFIMKDWIMGSQLKQDIKVDKILNEKMWTEVNKGLGIER